VPKRAQANLPVRLSYYNLKSPSRDWLVGSKVIRDGVVTATSFTSDANDLTAVGRVVNMTNDDCFYVTIYVWVTRTPHSYKRISVVVDFCKANHHDSERLSKTLACHTVRLEDGKNATIDAGQPWTADGTRAAKRPQNRMGKRIRAFRQPLDPRVGIMRSQQTGQGTAEAELRIFTGQFDLLQTHVPVNSTVLATTYSDRHPFDLQACCL
jgi:hypothetical protein